MTNHVEHPDYPLEITPDEGRLGFGVKLLGQLDSYNPDRWIPAVCKVLSSSDIIVKTTGFVGGVMYSHQRFGTMDLGVPIARHREPEWNPVGNPYETCEQAVLEAEIGASEVGAPIVHGETAPIKDA